jgi:AraC-like DNA-binding protein
MLADRPAISVPLFSVRSLHEPGFVVDRPQGKDFFVFMRFVTAVVLQDTDGRRMVAAGSGIFYAPGFPQWYASGPEGMDHAWFHCAGAGVADCAERYHIPVNRALDLSGFLQTAPFLQDVQRQQLRREEFWAEAVSLRAAGFFLELGRAVHSGQHASETRYQAQMRETLRRVRAAVHAELGRAWTVPEMAEMAHLSPSRFRALYSELFGISPVGDLIEARLWQARSLLEQTPDTIERIAQRCGFASPAHFSRLFRARIGCPPSRYG